MGHLSLVKRHGCTTWHGQSNMINEPLKLFGNEHHSSITFLPSSQVWTSWSSCRATRTRKSTRKPSTWSSATSTLKMRTPLWLPPLICSSSSSSSSSARPRWKASSYNASLSPMRHRHSHLCSFISLSAHCHDQGLRQPSAPLLLSLLIVREIDLIIIMIMKNVTLREHVCVRMSNVGQVLQSCQPVCEGFTYRSVLRWAHLCAWKPPTYPGPQRLPLADCLCNTTPSYFLDFLFSSSQIRSTSPCSCRISNSIVD